MVTLKKIKKVNNNIVCEYYKECSANKEGTISMSIDNTDIYQVKTLKNNVTPFDSYVAHALRTLRAIANGEKELKEEYTIMWY